MDKLLYAKYGNDRKQEFSITTCMYRKQNNQVWIEKRPKSSLAVNHIKNIENNYYLLSENKKNDKVKINKCYRNNVDLKFEYIQGELFSNRLDSFINDEDYPGFIQQVKWYIDIVESLFNTVEFRITDKFIEVFGKVNFTKPAKSLEISNIDLAFDNIIINDFINIIDYEWVFDFPIPQKFIVFRALNAYIMKGSLEKKINLYEICKLFDINSKEIEQYQKMEDNFQNYVNGCKVNKIENTSITIDEILYLKEEKQKAKQIQIFQDYGKGFSEEESYWISIKETEKGLYKLTIPINCKIKNLRIDPTDKYCVLNIKSVIIANENKSYVMNYNTNALCIKDSLVYMHNDPQIIFSNIDKYQVTYLEILFKFTEIDIDVLACIQAIYKENQDINNLNQNILSDKKILQNELGNYIECNKQLQQEVDRLIEEICERDNKLNELEEQIRLLKEIVENRENMCSALESQLYIHEQEKIELQKEVSCFSNKLQIKENELKKIKSTRVWKIIEKLMVRGK